MKVLNGKTWIKLDLNVFSATLGHIARVFSLFDFFTKKIEQVIRIMTLK